MTRILIGLAAFSLLASVSGPSSQGQEVYNLLVQRINESTSGGISPTVLAPTARLSMFDEFGTPHHSDNWQPNSVDLNDAVGTAGAALQGEGYSGEVTVLGRATCLNTIGATDVLAQCDCVCSPKGDLMSVLGPEWDTSIWNIGAVISTGFNILNNPNHPAVPGGTMNGQLRAFAHQNNTWGIPVSVYGMPEYKIVQVILGSSQIIGVYDDNNTPEWIVSKTLQTSTVNNPNSPPIEETIAMPWTGFDEFCITTEFVPVGSTQQLVTILTGNPAGPSPLDGSSYGDIGYLHEYKASGSFTVTSE